MPTTKPVWVAAILIAAPAWGQTPGASWDVPRLPLSLQLRDGLLDQMDAVKRAIAAPGLGPEAQRDLAQIATHRAALFDGTDRIGAPNGSADFALFYDPDHRHDLLRDLSDLAQHYDLRIALHRKSDASARALARDMGLDIWPGYVFPTLMLRGRVPAGVLPRYLSQPGTTD